MSYTPDCADCPTPDDCKAKKDCQVLRQIRHGRDLFQEDKRATTGAVFSPCRLWRYRLWRVWDPALPRALFCLMNPSTADEVENDATVARCVERVQRWAVDGYLCVGGVEVVNAFAWRETDSKRLSIALRAGLNIVGPENDDHIAEACRQAAIVVCGWGNPAHKLMERGPALLQLLRGNGVVPMALKVNRNGSPQHPLYIGYDVLPVPL
jgi:hypothetical protein